MKYLTIFCTALYISACCSSKGIIDNSINETIQKRIVKNSIVKNITHEEKMPVAIVESKDSVLEDYDSEPIKESIEKPDHYDFNQLLEKHVSVEGLVNYINFKSDQKDLQNYIAYLGKTLPTEQWNKEDKLAYWINAYNAMTIDLVLRNYPLKSIKDIYKPWDQRLWKLGTKWYNLDEIEHRILRKMNEPRIHFAIVCASFSCPKLQNKAFNAKNINAQLTNATVEFLSDSKRNEITTNNLELSKIFQWFYKDFKQDSSLIQFLNKYSDVNISEKADIRYKDYHWDLNELNDKR